MNIPPYQIAFGGAWESFRMRIGDKRLYCCRRPVNCVCDWQRVHFPYGHVYVLKHSDGVEDGDTIEHYVFLEESPLEMQSVIYEMLAKYAP